MLLQIIIGVVIVFFTIVGIVEIWQNARQYFFMPPASRVTFMVTVRGHDEEIEYIIRSLVFKARELHFKSMPEIMVVDEGMDDETRQICEKLSQMTGCIRICKTDDLAGVICKEKGLQNQPGRV